jgi:hypothetical protein
MLGMAGMLSYGAARLAAKTGMLGYHRYTLIAVPVAHMPEMPRGFKVVELSLDALSEHEIDVSRAVQQARFAQGLSCLAAFNAKDELVGVTWVGTDSFIEDEVHVRFSVPDYACWDTGLWMKPEHRMSRGFAALWAGTAHWLKVHGLHWSMSRIADYNMSSITSHQRMGAVIIGHVTILRIFNWQWMAKGRPRMVKLHKNAPANLKMALSKR